MLEQKFTPLSEDPDIKGKTPEELMAQARAVHQENVQNDELSQERLKANLNSIETTGKPYEVE